MTNQQGEEAAGRFQVKATADSHFSWIRTRLSLERTLMSWVRTATALIGFGFTIVQFFERFSEMKGVAPALRPQAPRYLGLALIAAGVLALLISLWQYRLLLRHLWGKEFRAIAGVAEAPAQTPVIAVSVLLLLIGILAFVAVLARIV